jgi:excinuclease ABC subunit C
MQNNKENNKFDHEEILKTIPNNPGCYIMKDKSKKIVYIGKAKNLNTRVKNYFQKSGDDRAFIKFLSDILSDIEVIITNTEEDALKLEATLIRLHKPKYNIIYKDGKSELLIKLDDKSFYPRLELVREYDKNDKSFYIGPFFQSTRVRNLISTLNRLFKLRSCTDSVLKTSKRACLEYEIHRCSGPCIKEITEENYAIDIIKLKKFLSGKGNELIKELETEMYSASNDLLFEKAAKLRDQIKMLKYYLRVHLASVDYKKNIDIIGYFVLDNSLSISILIIRNGLIIDKKIEIFNNIKFPSIEMIESIIMQYYSKRTVFPEEVLLPDQNFDFKLFNEHFKNTKSEDINFFYPERKNTLSDLLIMANKNAQISLEKEYYLKNKNDKLLETIKQTFNLINLPNKIECFDNSNFQGINPVASKVEFRNAIPYKKGYRHFKIQTVVGPDDYASMREIINRRITKGLKENSLPDLIVVDGGKGQLSSAYKVLEELNVHDKVDLLSLAKIKSSDKDKAQYYERVFKVGDAEPKILKQNSPEIVLFVKLRDEAHRFAIEYHRKLREKTSIQSVLNQIEGIGSKRKQTLLKHFKSIENIKKATLKEIEETKGISKDIAKKIYDFFL